MSRRFWPTTLVYTALDQGDDQEQPRRPSKGGIRTSGLRIPGLPRPGKTTQGQETRRSSEPKKSFRTIRNFWRQLEGGQEPVVRRPFGRKPAPPKVEQAPARISAKQAQERKSMRKSSITGRRKQSKGSTHEEAPPAARTSQNVPTSQEEEPSASSRTTQHLPSVHGDDHPSSRTTQHIPSTHEEELHTSRRTTQRSPTMQGEEQLPSGRSSQHTSNVQEEELRTSRRSTQRLPSMHAEEHLPSARHSQHSPSTHEEELHMSHRTSQHLPSIHGEEYHQSARHSQHIPSTREEELLHTSHRTTQRLPAAHGDEHPQSLGSIHRMPSIPEEVAPLSSPWPSSHPGEGTPDLQPSIRHGSRVSTKTEHEQSQTARGQFEEQSGEDVEEEEEETENSEEVDTEEIVEESYISRRYTSPGERTSRQQKPQESAHLSRLSLGHMEELMPSLRPQAKSLPFENKRSRIKFASEGPRRASGLASLQPLDQLAHGDLTAGQDIRAGTESHLEDETGEKRASRLSATLSRQLGYSPPTAPPLPPPPPPPLPPPAFLKPPTFWHTPRDAALAFKRPSIVLPVLLDEEKHFHEMIAAGDVMAVQDFLETRPNFNINCSNYQGTSALLIAVKEGNEEMTLFLLAQPNLEIGDAHLYAIRDNRPIILRMILDTFQSINPSLEFMACANSAEFAENVTPLILAAQSGHYDIIGILLERGHTIPVPHPPRCFCKEECQVIMLTEDPLSVASGKLHIYRALCNPAYICQTSDDPFLTAFKLSQELRVCGHVEQTYMRQYEDLAEATRNFAVDLIAEARSLEEVETIISETRGMDLKGSYIYPRLIMAMDYKQKEFVAHPNIQQVLEKTWLGDWVAWKGYRKYIRALYFLPRVVMLPGILVILMFLPTSSWAKHYALPINKLLSNVASYSIFLVLVFIQSNVDKKNQTRDTKPTGVEIFLAIYVLAFLYNSIRSLIIEGPKRYFSFMWNLYELIMEALFLLTFIFWITAAVKTTVTGTKDVERKYWHYMDAELIAEGLFVLAAIMAYMKILLICQMSYDLGPLQVSLGKMTNDCAIFSIILGIIMLAFTVGLCRFYSYYDGMEQKNPDTGEVESKQENSFTSFHETFKTLFWGLFGMPSFEVADVVLDNLNDADGKPTIINEHHFTESIGYIVFAIYMTLTVIVILNMLIATMSNTFQKVTDNVDMEWAFGRTEVKLAYMNKPVLPPPFNLIPTTKGLVDLFKGAKAKAGEMTGIGLDVEKGLIQEEKKVEEFNVLMSQLVQRYFSTKSDVDA